MGVAGEQGGEPVDLDAVALALAHPAHEVFAEGLELAFARGVARDEEVPGFGAED